MIGIDPLLDLAESLEGSAGSLYGLGSDLGTVFDPALMAALGELGLSEDIGVLNALEQGTRLTLNSAEQRRRLGRNFGPGDILNATRWSREEGMSVMLDLLLGGKFLESSARQPELAPMLRTQLFLVVAFLDVIAIIGVAIGLLFTFANPFIN